MGLNDEQLESIVQGDLTQPAGLDAADRRRVAEARAIRERLRGACGPLRAGEELRRRVADACAASAGAPGRHAAVFSRRGAAAAAAGVLVAAGAGLYLATRPSAAMAADEALVAIHRANLSAAGQLQPYGDANAVAARLGEQLGATVRVPQRAAAGQLVGWRVASLRGRPVGSYVLRRPDGSEVSIVISPLRPKELGWPCTCGQPDCRCVHEEQCQGCGLAARRAGGLTYCAVGSASPAAMRALLASLLGSSAPRR